MIHTVRSIMTSAFTAAGAVALLLAPLHSALAQGTPSFRPRVEFLVASGGLIPTGAQRGVLKRGGLTAAQLSVVVAPSIALTGTFAWARSRDIASAGDPKLDVFTYDLGAEARANRWVAGEKIFFSPFVGLGAGGRSYNYRSLDVDATHNLAAYGSAGGELGYGRVRLRAEVRDYVSGFAPLVGAGGRVARNDVAVMFGLRIAGPGM